MHLPPLDVAVYPIFTMSRGVVQVQPDRPSSTSSSSSSSSTTSSRTWAAQPNSLGIQKVIQMVFRCPGISIQDAHQFQGHLHQVYLTKLADGSNIVLKCPPAYNVRLLRHEKHSLETESRALEILHQYTQIPVPNLIKYDSQGGPLGMPFLMTSYLPGCRLSEVSPHLTLAERQTIDRTLGGYVRALTTLSATQFGTTYRVYAKKGSSSWREAFHALLEAALRDAEDMLVTIPYDSIRYYIAKHAHVLDQVTEPRLVAFNVCDPTNVLVDQRLKQITGLVGFSNIIWGDPLMSGGIADGSAAFFEGFGERPVQTDGAKLRMSMYAVYRATVKIVSHHYRTNLNIDELATRRDLSHALHDLAAV